ncbi:hypothetical protein HaLaN_23085, partial [Haematococcus lacustris]
MLSLQDLLADRLFLAELAKEFELLKASQAAVVADPPGQGAIGAGEPDRLALSHTARDKTRVSGPHPPLSACLMVPGEGAAPFTAARPAMASEPKLPQPPEAAEVSPSEVASVPALP